MIRVLGFSLLLRFEIQDASIPLYELNDCLRVDEVQTKKEFSNRTPAENQEILKNEGKLALYIAQEKKTRRRLYCIPVICYARFLWCEFSVYTQLIGSVDDYL